MADTPHYYALANGTVFAVDPPLRLEVWADQLHILYHDASMERWDYATVARKLQERDGHLYRMHLSQDLIHEVRAIQPEECDSDTETLNWPAVRA